MKLDNFEKIENYEAEREKKGAGFYYKSDKGSVDWSWKGKGMECG